MKNSTPSLVGVSETNSLELYCIGSSLAIKALIARDDPIQYNSKEFVSLTPTKLGVEFFIEHNLLYW